MTEHFAVYQVPNEIFEFTTTDPIRETVMEVTGRELKVRFDIAEE